MLASVARHLGSSVAAAAPTATTESVEVTDDAGFALSISGPTPTLTPDEERAYALDGLVVPQAQLSPGATAALQDLVERTLAVTCAADPPVEMPVAPHCPTNLYGGHGDPIPEEVASMWMALARHPAILDRVEAILGADFILWGAQLFHKPARTGLEVPWHQDGRYWPIHPPASCSVWVSIDEADEANGAMGWIPGSAQPRTLFEHNRDEDPALALNQVLDFEASGLEESKAALNVLPAGGFSLHDVYLVHNSRPNLSDKRRAGFVMRYMPSSSLFDPTRLPAGVGGAVKNSNSANFERPIFLMRGSARENAGYPGLVDARGRAPTVDEIVAGQAAARGSSAEPSGDS